jgi:hypothetical protein
MQGKKSRKLQKIESKNSATLKAKTPFLLAKKMYIDSKISRHPSILSLFSALRSQRSHGKEANWKKRMTTILADSSSKTDAMQIAAVFMLSLMTDRHPSFSQR